MLKESDDIVLLGVTFDSKMTFEKHLSSVSRVASQRLGILRKSCQKFHDRFLHGRSFRDLSCPFWSAILQCGARLPIHHLKLLDRVVSGARFLTRGVFECDLAHRRSVAVLCMLYKIRCSPVHHLYGALRDPHVPVRVAPGAVIAQRYTYAPPRCRSS